MSLAKVEALTSFIKDLYGTNDFIPLHVPTFRGNESEYIQQVLNSKQVSTSGFFIDKFEKDLAEFICSRGAEAVINGTAALHIALRACGVGSGDEVITQALSYVATANAISYNNAEPVFLDVDMESMGLSPKALSDFLDEFGEIRDGQCFNRNTGKRLKACVPMHTFGFIGAIDEICRICLNWKIEVVEDAAEALGSTFRGQHAGTFGRAGAYSFNGNKVITAGGGGAVVSDDISLLRRIRSLSTTAKRSHPWHYFHEDVAYNYRMPNVNAALVCGQIELLDELLSKKKLLADQYAEFCLAHGIIFRKDFGACKANYWLNSIELESFEERESFLKESNNLGVMTRPIWNLLYEMPMYKMCFRDDQHNSKWLADRILNIPSSVS